MQNNEYRNRFAISQTAIKDFRFKSPKRWKDVWVDKIPEEKNDDIFMFGNLVDTMLFTPSLIEERFYIADVNKIPKGAIEKIVSRVFDTYKVSEKEYDIKRNRVIDDPVLPEIYEEVEYDLSPLKAVILSACKEEDWNGTWKDDTRINKIIEKGSEYFELLEKAKGREVITSELNFDAIVGINNLRNDENVNKYFIDSDRYKNIYQLEIFMEYTTDSGFKIPLKCAIDILHIDYENKILQLIDFKTTSKSAFDFLKSIKQYGYCDQLSFYQYILNSFITTDRDFAEEFNITSDFTFALPINIVIDRDEKIPYVYQYNAIDIDIAKRGNEQYYVRMGIKTHGLKIKKGWEQLLLEIGWHLENREWAYPKEHYLNGRIEVNLLNT